MKILGIDPGPKTSGVVLFDSNARRVLWASGEFGNDAVLSMVRVGAYDRIACESIEAMYAHVGKETVRTIRFTGRIEESAHNAGKVIALMSPQEIKKTVCYTSSAKDPAVRQALIDKVGPVGTKKNQGPCYGVSKHAWRALAAAVASEYPKEGRK